MCGIVGTAGASNKTNDNVLETLLILDQLRGIDSTGVAVISRQNEVRIAKNIGTAYDLLDTKPFNRAMGCMSRAIIGHNRSATSGTVTKKNAHPFENESLVGVHNGTLQSKWMLEDAKDFTVDSENLYHHIDKKGLKDCLANLNGAWSLVWWDKLEESLNFLRNKERPMFLTWSEDLKSLYWASERWMLSVALSRNGVKHTDITETEVDMHYRFDIDQEGVISKPHVALANSTYRGYQGNQAGFGFYGQQQQHKSSQQTTTPQIGHNATQQTRPVEKSIDRSVSYTGKRDVTLEVLAQSSDPFGGKYYVCFDPLEPARSIRLYLGRYDVDGAMLTKEIICDISPAVYLEGDKHYHKVSYSSIRVKEDVLDHVEYFNDANGRKLTEENWIQKYGCCAACGGFVNPRQAFRFTTDNQTVCHDCAEDKEVALYIGLK